MTMTRFSIIVTRDITESATVEVMALTLDDALATVTDAADKGDSINGRPLEWHIDDCSAGATYAELSEELPVHGND